MKSETRELNLGWGAWKRFPGWLIGPTLFRVFVLVVLASSLLGDWAGVAMDTSRQDRIRYAGWLLDVFGLGTIAAGVIRKLDLFHGESLWSLLKEGFKSWLRLFPFIRRHVIIHASTGHLKLGPMSAKGRATVRLNPNATIERKVEFLLQRNDELTEQLFGLQDEVGQNKKELVDELTKVRAAIEKSIGEIVSRTEDAHVGEVGWEFVGLAWIFLGITFSTVPEFIEAWFGWLIAWFEALASWLLSII